MKVEDQYSDSANKLITPKVDRELLRYAFGELKKKTFQLINSSKDLEVNQ